MGNWQLTATTIICQQNNREVTIFVYKNGQVQCTGSGSPAGKNKKIPVADCTAETCKQVAEYKLKLDAEENIG